MAWLSIQQPYTALSTCESELIACSEGLTLSEALRPLICELAQEKVPWSFMNDSVSANTVLSFPAGSWRTRHLRVRCNAFHEHLEEGEMVLNHIAGKYMLGDLLTKTLTLGRIKDLMRYLGCKGTGLHEASVPGSTVARPGPAVAVKLLVVSWSVVPVDAQGRNHNSLWENVHLQWVVMGMIVILAIFVWVFSSWIGKNEAHRLRIMAEHNQVASFPSFKASKIPGPCVSSAPQTTPERPESPAEDCSGSSEGNRGTSFLGARTRVACGVGKPPLRALRSRSLSALRPLRVEFPSTMSALRALRVEFPSTMSALRALRVVFPSTLGALNPSQTNKSIRFKGSSGAMEALSWKCLVEMSLA